MDMSLHWLPNAISIMRIALVGPVVYLILKEDFANALLLFLVAGISDGIDGFLARTFRWQSNIGALLDPLADKMLTIGSFAALWSLGMVPAWLALLVVIRDVVIMGGAATYHLLIGPVEGNATVVSKFNTVMVLLLVLCLLSAAAYGWPGDNIITLLGAAVFVTVVISGVDYVWSWSIKAKTEK